MAVFCLYTDCQYILPVISVVLLNIFLIFGVLLNPEKTTAVLRRGVHAECKGVLIQGDKRINLSKITSWTFVKVILVAWFK